MSANPSQNGRMDGSDSMPKELQKARTHRNEHPHWTEMEWSEVVDGAEEEEEKVSLKGQKL
jgi:hypothetical protein